MCCAGIRRPACASHTPPPPSSSAVDNSNIDFYKPHKGHTLLIGYWLLAIGYWLLAIGYWLLAIGSWLARVIKGDKEVVCFA
jgi:hypothetical protein